MRELTVILLTVLIAATLAWLAETTKDHDEYP